MLILYFNDFESNFRPKDVVQRRRRPWSGSSPGHHQDGQPQGGRTEPQVHHGGPRESLREVRPHWRHLHPQGLSHQREQGLWVRPFLQQVSSDQTEGEGETNLFPGRADAEDAIDALDGRKYDGRELSVQYAR